MTGDSKPQSPTVTSVVTDGKRVRVTWRTAGDGGHPLIGYTVTLDDGTTAYVTGTAETALLTTTSAAKTHTATVTAVTLAGTSDATTAAAPTDEPTISYEPSPFPDETLDADYPSDTWPATDDGSDYFNGLPSGICDLGPDILGAATGLS